MWSSDEEFSKKKKKEKKKKKKKNHLNRKQLQLLVKFSQGRFVSELVKNIEIKGKNTSYKNNYKKKKDELMIQ